jgi:site-specific DNA-methyltransferase (adenine-specific)
MKPYYEASGITIYHGDCREVLQELPSRSVQLVMTDPPFSIPVKYHDTDRDYPRSWGDLLVMEPFYVEVFREIHRVTKPSGQVYISCDSTSYPVFFKASYSLWDQSHLIVWYKPTGRRGHGWKHAHELILHLATKDVVYVNTFNQDVIGIMPVRTLDRQHPAEKPGELVGFLAELTSLIPATVWLDPFMGGGTTLVAAKARGVQAIGIEIEEWCCEIAVNRLQQEVLAFTDRPSMVDPEQLILGVA